MMELHRQQCQACQSYNMRNILVREPGMPTKIYVRCIDCREFVAVYELSHYYHKGKGIDSYLRSRGTGAAESGRDMLEDFQQVKQKAHEAYEEVLEELKRQGKDG